MANRRAPSSLLGGEQFAGPTRVIYHLPTYWVYGGSGYTAGWVTGEKPKSPPWASARDLVGPLRFLKLPRPACTELCHLGLRSG